MVGDDGSRYLGSTVCPLRTVPLLLHRKGSNKALSEDSEELLAHYQGLDGIP